jgi:hypothetical protein
MRWQPGRTGPLDPPCTRGHHVSQPAQCQPGWDLTRCQRLTKEDGDAAGATYTARRVLGCVALLLVCVSSGAQTAPQQAAASPRIYVQAQLQLSDAEFAALHSGRPMVKTLSSPITREMITIGGIRINGLGLSGFVEQFKTLEGFRTSQFVKQILKFSVEPDLRDLDVLVLDAEDIDALRQCRVGACDVQLSADDIRRFNTQIDWRSADAAVQATALYKTILFAHLSAYRAGGVPRLVHYNDHVVPRSLAEETTALLAARPSLLDQTAAFQYHLRDYPANRSESVQDFFYWSKEVFGFKPVIGLNHVSIHTDGNGGALIATTQIYASHYMDGSVNVNALLPDTDAAGPGFYWLYMNRSRIGRLDGMIGTLSRPIMQRRARAGLTKSLLQTKQRLEAVP